MCEKNLSPEQAGQGKQGLAIKGIAAQGCFQAVHQAPSLPVEISRLLKSLVLTCRNREIQLMTNVKVKPELLASKSDVDVKEQVAHLPELLRNLEVLQSVHSTLQLCHQEILDCYLNLSLDYRLLPLLVLGEQYNKELGKLINYLAKNQGA